MLALGAGHHHGRAAPRRVARRALQAGVPAARAEDQGPDPGPRVDARCGRSATRSGRRPPSPAGRRRARRSPTSPSPRRCSTPSRAGTPEDPRTPWTKPRRLDGPARARRGPRSSGSPSASGGRRTPASRARFGGVQGPLPARAPNVISCLMEIQRNPVNAAGQTDHAGHLGRGLPRGGLRQLHDGHQRPGAAGLLGAGGQARAADHPRADAQVPGGARPRRRPRAGCSRR